MSIRYTGMFISAATPDTIVFSTKAVQITGVSFLINSLKIPFTTAAIGITSNSFSIIRGVLNIDNGFMAF